MLDPRVSHSKFLSLVPLATSLPNLVPQSKLQVLDTEWRRLTINPLPFDHEDMEPEEFWGRVSNITVGSGTLQFAVLSEFLQNLLCLPHTNVDVERVFSSVAAIKKKGRNRLHTKSVHAILKVKQGVAESGGCVKFSPSTEAKSQMTSDILYGQDSSDESDVN